MEKPVVVMADNFRSRSQQFGRVSDQLQELPPEEDPLAELARLIGQDQAFIATSREARPPHASGASAPRWLGRTGAAEPREGASRGQLGRVIAGPPLPVPDVPVIDQLSEDDAPEVYERQPAAQYRRRERLAETDAEPVDPYAVATLDGRYDHPPGEEYEADGLPASTADYQEEYTDEAGYGEEIDAGETGHGRFRIRTVAAALGVVLIGTAGLAFAYRAWTGGPSSAEQVPVIKADASPTKIAPAPSGDNQPNKLIYDRIGEKLQAEHIVSREEQPVDLQETSPPAAPRVIFPSPGTVTIGGQPTAALEIGSSGPPDSKRVHTISIRPDQPANVPDTNDATASTPALSAAPAQSVAPAPAPRPAAPAGRAAARTGSANAPLALNQSAEGDNPGVPSRAAPKPAATRTAALPKGEAGGYVVQLSSQRSETEAQASFRALQAKYPDVLGDRQALIRRADLGSKGVYYRAQVGPFESADEANQFCGDLKSAGGQCIVQRN